MAALHHLLVCSLLLLSPLASKGVSRIDVLDVVEDEDDDFLGLSFLELHPDVDNGYQELLAEYEDLASDPLMPKPNTTNIPSLCFSDKPPAELRTEMLKDVNASKSKCMTMARLEFRDCDMYAPCPTITNETLMALEWPDCNKEVDGDDCTFLSDYVKKSECVSFRNAKLAECEKGRDRLKSEWTSHMQKCNATKKQCKIDYNRSSVECVQLAVVERSIGEVRLESARLHAANENSTLEKGKLDITDEEYAGLMETPDFKAALDASKACQGTNDLYYELIAVTVNKLVKDWKAVYAEFQQKKQKIANLNLGQYKSDCLPKEYAAMAAMGDFSSKAGFLKTLGYACGSGCEWDGENCQTYASKEKEVQQLEASFKTCLTQFAASGTMGAMADARAAMTASE